jgi:alpha-tubulin suppressor-like RCC1 family protein
MNSFPTTATEAFTLIREEYGNEVFFENPRFVRLLRDLSPKTKEINNAVRLIYSADFFADFRTVKNRVKLRRFFDMLISRGGVEVRLAEELFSAYAHVLGIDISDVQKRVVKTVTAASVKRIPQTLSGKFSQCGFIDFSGNLFTWGSNEFGSAGALPETPERDLHEPVRLPRLIASGIKSVSMGWSFSLALKYDGTLLGFGENRFGGLGFDMPEFSAVPVPIMKGIAYADCGGTLHSYAVRFDGSLVSLRSPNTPPLLTDCVSVSAGMVHSLAITSDGTLWAWGENRFGQLGDGSKANRTTPAFVMNDVIAAYAGTYHSIAIKSDKTLWTWGLIPDIERDGSAEIQQTSPVCFMSDVKTAAAGELHSLAVKTDGSVWAWGKNFYGQLGDGTTVNRPLPVKIADNVEEVSAGVCCSFCRKKDMSIWSWGLNENCELGDGTEINRLLPVRIK